MSYSLRETKKSDLQEVLSTHCWMHWASPMKGAKLEVPPYLGHMFGAGFCVPSLVSGETHALHPSSCTPPPLLSNFHIFSCMSCSFFSTLLWRLPLYCSPNTAFNLVRPCQHRKMKRLFPKYWFSYSVWGPVVRGCLLGLWSLLEFFSSCLDTGSLLRVVLFEQGWGQMPASVILWSSVVSRAEHKLWIFTNA